MADRLDVSKSVEMYKRACSLIPAGSQTNSKRATAYAPGAFPIYFDSGKGCRITDVDGNTYVDYILALGPITLGYCYDAIDEAVAEQLEKGIIAGLLSPLEIEVVERLQEAVPCCEMARFMKGGAEGTQAAARIARGFTGNDVILNSGYRGWADQWAAQSGNPAVPEVLGETIEGFPRDDLETLEQLLEKHRGNVAMIAVDVASGTAAPQEVVEGMRRLADEHNTLLMFDEIVTGFRMARGGAQEYYGVTPDLAVFAKGMANGMPIAAVCGREDVMRPSKDLVISITYGGEALSLAGANAALKVYENEPVSEHMFAQGEKLGTAFERIAEENGVPFKCHGPACQQSMTFDYEDGELVQDVWTLLLQEMAKRGVLLRRGGLLFITYSHDDEAIEQTIAAMEQCMPIIADAVENDTVSDLLETSEVEKSFRSFT